MYPEEMSGLVTRDLRAPPPGTAAALEAAHRVAFARARSERLWRLLRGLLAGPLNPATRSGGAGSSM
jgi:hypothetical protein